MPAPTMCFCKRMTYLLWIAYKGTNYGGFQVQPNAPTVCAAVQDAMQRVLGCRPDVKGCSRTDAGVHAYGQECTFYTESRIPQDRFVHAMNALLPRDIRVRQSREVDEDFSVRRRNFGKTYGYLLTESREASPFLVRTIWRTGKQLDLAKMEAAAKVLEGRHDFTSFRGNNAVPSDPVRLIHEIRLRKVGPLIWIYVTGEGFLYHMVRNIAGALVDAGSSVLAPDDLERILEARDRRELGLTAPAEGLALLKVYFQPITKEAIDETLQEPLYPWCGA